MTANIGDTDRYIRIAVGCALIIWGALGGPIWAFFVGAILVATGFLRVCPVYLILGANTCGAKKE